MQNPKKLLWVVSNYISNSYPLDDNDNVIIQNRDKTETKILSINDAILRFQKNIRPYNILKKYIWDLDNKKSHYL